MLIAVAYVPDKKTGTAAEFDRASQFNAKAFWMWAVQAAFVCLSASLWWAIIPAFHAVHSAVAWSSCRRGAERLRHETIGSRRGDSALRRLAANTNELDRKGMFTPSGRIRPQKALQASHKSS